MNRTTSKPGMTGSAKKRDDFLEFRNGEIGDFRTVNVTFFRTVIREDTDQVFHAF